VERSAHIFRLRPVHDEHQELVDHELHISAKGLRRDYEDVFGNQATSAELESPYSELRIIARSLVRVMAEPSPQLLSPARRVTLPLVWMPWQRQMMLPYLLPPELPETQLTELYEYALSFVKRQDSDLVQTLLDMNLTIYRDFRYVSGSTTLATTPFDVYGNRRGVCQDFANLMICLARLLNIPARYRVGYIYTGASYENKLQSEASHAWMEVYLPRVGWQGFDPTNGCFAGLDHVRVASGRNYVDATPTSGTLYKGGGGETLSVAVRVEEDPSPDMRW
jgi:transglutaminase-like putative cysteine protease